MIFKKIENTVKNIVKDIKARRAWKRQYRQLEEIAERELRVSEQEMLEIQKILRGEDGKDKLYECLGFEKYSDSDDDEIVGELGGESDVEIDGKSEEESDDGKLFEKMVEAFDEDYSKIISSYASSFKKEGTKEGRTKKEGTKEETTVKTKTITDEEAAKEIIRYEMRFKEKTESKRWRKLVLGITVLAFFAIGAGIGVGILGWKKYGFQTQTSQTPKIEIIEMEKGQESKELETKEMETSREEIEKIRSVKKRIWLDNGTIKPDSNELELKIINDAWDISGMKGLENPERNEIYLLLTFFDGKREVLKFENNKVKGYIKNGKPSDEIKYAEVVQLKEKQREQREQQKEPYLLVHATYDATYTVNKKDESQKRQDESKSQEKSQEKGENEKQKESEKEKNKKQKKQIGIEYGIESAKKAKKDLGKGSGTVSKSIPKSIFWPFVLNINKIKEKYEENQIKSNYERILKAYGDSLNGAIREVSEILGYEISKNKFYVLLDKYYGGMRKNKVNEAIEKF